MLEPAEPLPMPLEPDEEPDGVPDDEPVESMDEPVRGDGVGTLPVSSTFLPQAPRASKAANATDAAVRFLT